MRKMFVLSAIFILLTFSGCGGGNHGGAQLQTTPVRFDIAWQQRSRVINAVSSALSAVLTLKGAKPDHSDFTFTVDRNDAPAAYTQTYTSSSPATVGTRTATVTFYANKGGQGAVVGVASKAATIKPDGSGIGDIDTIGTITSVAVVPGQTLLTGLSQDLLFSAMDANNHVVAVTPGSATWSMVNVGSLILQLIPSGTAAGIVPGTVQVSVTVDGKTSAPADVQVLQNPASPVSSVVAEATSVANGPSVRVRWKADPSGNVAVQQFQLFRLPDFPFTPSGGGGGINNGGGSGLTGGNGGGGVQISVPAAVGGPALKEIFDQPSPFFPFSQGGSTLLSPGAQGCSTTLPPSADTGFLPGQSYRYQLSAAAIPNGSAGCFQTDPLQSGLATPIVPVSLTTPLNNATAVNLRQFSPTFASRNAADVFQVEVSTDNTFKNAARIWRQQTISTSPNSDGVTQSLPQPVDLTTSPELLTDPAFANFVHHVAGAPAPRVYWRVGARHDEDSPGPVHYISQDPADPDRTFRWVYSASFSFLPQ